MPDAGSTHVFIVLRIFHALSTTRSQDDDGLMITSDTNGWDSAESHEGRTAMAPYWSPSDDCKVGCGQPSRAKGSYLCEPHFRLLHRQDAKRAKRGRKIDREVRFRAMQAQWNEAIGGFECHLTKVKLSDDQFSPMRASPAALG
jgi:hypothetical protein